LDIKPKSIDVDGDTLKIEWERSTTINDNPHKSEYDVAWLREWTYALKRVETKPIPNDVAKLEINFKELTER
jgi:hypothetical protein